MPSLPRSPLAPEHFPELPPVGGVEAATAATADRYRGRPDLLTVRLAAGTQAGGVFTRSQLPAAPVLWTQRALATRGGGARGLVVNAGNANAFTGRAGERAAAATAERFAAAIGADAGEILLASTGVIGEPLDTDRLTQAFPALAFGDPDWQAAAAAISTTDTFAKGAGAETEIGGRAVRLAGIAKGSGMICPDMATMLAFVFTDAAIEARALQALIAEANETSFNAISVDGDTSTSDMVLLFATGAAGGPAIAEATDARLGGFREALSDVMTDLAQQVVRDGEGARKFVTVEVTGAPDNASAKQVALAIANSPLVKTAIAGEDPNWGRILMAAGKTGVPLDPERLALTLGDQRVTHAGARHPDYDEAAAAAHLTGAEIRIALDLGAGAGAARVWTCDLTEGYIRINADYRS